MAVQHRRSGGNKKPYEVHQRCAVHHRESSRRDTKVERSLRCSRGPYRSKARVLPGRRRPQERTPEKSGEQRRGVEGPGGP
ncbi:hypothetical protein NDU88_006772 [Pleurodeles waltl]|uniref:Uncharacterized protein n=1 Tax=Pleurodeles waltl TaxID=8319 RepID=A0AAV7WFR5_PLEWA|nr:hypothetical protein NDU88_006772 [Pleurodeles waltl]